MPNFNRAQDAKIRSGSAIEGLATHLHRSHGNALEEANENSQKNSCRGEEAIRDLW